MLRGIHDPQNLAVQATDRLIGEVSDFYFDDETWVVRYLIVGPGSWLSSRKVLISATAPGCSRNVLLGQCVDYRAFGRS